MKILVGSMTFLPESKVLTAVKKSMREMKDKIKEMKDMMAVL